MCGPASLIRSTTVISTESYSATCHGWSPPTESDRRLREQLDTTILRRATPLLRLYAFGADAYRLAIGLRRIVGDRLSSIAGHSGRLSVDANHRISRRLEWARFADGVPAPHEPGGTGVEPSTPSPVR